MDDKADTRIISTCATQREFVSRFHQRWDGAALSIPTASPLSVGARDWFSISLATGETVLRGFGVVIECEAAGMRVALTHIDPESESVFQWLVAFKRLATGDDCAPEAVGVAPVALAWVHRGVAKHAVAFAAGLAAAYAVWGQVS